MNRKQHGNFRPQTFKTHRENTPWMATQQQSFGPSYFLLWTRGARAELERLGMEKKRLLYDTYFRLGITWESANPFYVYVEPKKRWERYSGRTPDPSVCHWSPSLSLLLQLRQASRKLSFCSSIYTLRQCCEKRRRSGGTWSTRASESRREREKRSEHTTLCTQNPDPPPYNKIDGIRWDHVSPLTVQLNSYGARYALAGVGSAKRQASLHQRATMTSSASLYSDSENGYLYYVCVCVYMCICLCINLYSIFIHIVAMPLEFFLMFDQFLSLHAGGPDYKVQAERLNVAMVYSQRC